LVCRTLEPAGSRGGQRHSVTKFDEGEWSRVFYIKIFWVGVAFVISNLVAYLINIYWVFVPGRYNWILEVGLFYLVSGVAIVIGTALMGILIRRFGMLTTYAFGSNVFVALMINYAMRKFFIFNG
jgi:putative flippase GtrA